MSKIAAVRDAMKEKGATNLVVTALDEVAWLLNLRGSDIVYNPVFFAYVILTMEEILFFVDEDRIDVSVRKHISGAEAVTVLPYAGVQSALEKLAKGPGKTLVSDKSSYALFNAVPENKRINVPSPVNILKAVKNEVEIQGMKEVFW